MNLLEAAPPKQSLHDARHKASAVTMVSGKVHFSAPKLRRLAHTFGSDIAWRAACFEQGIASAATNASGAFSVGINDGLGRTSLAVDRFATHTLCYRVTKGELRFARRAGALADAHTDIDPQAIFDYLFFHSIPSPRTIYRGIYRLPPGHYAVFEDGNLRVAPYWMPGPALPPKSSFSELREEFLQLLRKAVGKHLDGGIPACSLAGYTDSASVAATITALSGQSVRTYSVGFDANRHGETHNARLAAKHLGATHQEHHLSADDLVRSISTLASHYDQPFGSSMALSAYYCAGMARADGIKRLLISEGGDALFGSHIRYPTRRMLGWYGALPAMLSQHPGELAQTATRSSHTGWAQTRVPPPERLSLYKLLNRLGMERVFTPGFLHMVNPIATGTQPWQIWRHNCAEDTPPQENNVPMAYGISSLAGVSVGFPLLDQDLLNFWLNLPAQYLHKGQRLRWFFKEALRDLLPEPLLRKRQAGAGFPFGLWLCQHAGLRKLASDSLYSVAERGIVRRDFINTMLSQQLQLHPGYYGEMAWLLMVLEYWLRAHAPLYRVQV